MITHPPPRGVLLIVVLGAACMVYYHLGLFIPRAREVRAAHGMGSGYAFGADFYPIWLTSREARLEHRDPYSPENTREIQIALFGRPLDTPGSPAPSQYRAYAYPAFTNLMFESLGLLSFPAARVLVLFVLSAALALSVALWLSFLCLRASPIALAGLGLLTFSSYAVLEGLFAEQMGLFVGFLLAASMAALLKRRYMLSGTVLALTLIKPQMTVLVGVYLLLWSFAQWRDRQLFARGLALVSAVMGAASLLVWPHWIREWLHVMRGYGVYSTPPLVLYLPGQDVAARFGSVLVAAILLLATALAWRMRRAALDSPEFALTVSLLLAITAVTLLPGHAVYDHVVLLPGILLIAFSWRRLAAKSLPARLTLAAAALAIAWPWIWAPIVIAMRPLVSREFFLAVLLPLPIRTAASIPFGVAVILGLMLWQQTRKPAAGRPSRSGPHPSHFLRIFLRAMRFLAGSLASAARPRAT